MTASNGKWSNPGPSSVDHGVSLALQSLSSYLGGWIDWSGAADLSFSSGYTKGNAQVSAEYRVLGDWCTYRGTYVIGSTTTWGTGAINLKVPLLSAGSIFTAANHRIPGVMLYTTTGGYPCYIIQSLGSTLWPMLDNKFPQAAFLSTGYPGGQTTGSGFTWEFSYRVQT